MDPSNRNVDRALIVAFCVMIALTTIIAWYRLIGTENFRYVTDEKGAPERLDLSTY